MILFQRRAYFDTLIARCSPEHVKKEKGEINFSYPLMHMIATGQLFEPYLYHPDADVEERRRESEYCLQRLAEKWIAMFKWDKNPKNVVMDWEGEWLDSDFVKA